MSHQPPSQTQVFTLFPSLPLELRLSIWEHTITASLTDTTPRIHRLAPRTYPPTNTTSFMLLSRPIKSVPHFLHLCRDSRRVALRYYELWETVLGGDEDEASHLEEEQEDRKPRRVFVNREHDIFHFGQYSPTTENRRYLDYSDFEILHWLDMPTSPRREAILAKIKGIRNWAFQASIWEDSLLAFYGDESNYGDEIEEDDVPLWLRILVQSTDVRVINIIEAFQVGGGHQMVDQKPWFFQKISTAMRESTITDWVWEELERICPNVGFEKVDMRLVYVSDNPVAEREDLSWMAGKPVGTFLAQES